MCELRTPSRLLRRALVLAAATVMASVASATAGPIGMVCTNGTVPASGQRVFDLTARTGPSETPDGNSTLVWSYSVTGGSFQTPGPVLCVNQGDAVTVHLHNALAENVSIVFPGQEGVGTSGGATDGLFTREAGSTGDVTYTFTAAQPGTYLYESGSDQTKQVEMGLFGALVVRPAGHPDWAYADSSTQFDPKREYILVFSEVDPELHHAVETGGTYDINALHNRYFTVNGREFPDTIQDNGVSWLPNQPYGALVRVQPYNATQNALPALVRMVNAGELNHPFHPHGNHLRLIAQDGRLLRSAGGADASSEHFAETIGSGQSFDLLFKWTDQDSWDPLNNPIPNATPSYRNLTFKDGNTWYSGSPYLGSKGTLPTGTISQNVCGEAYFPWHSHALNEFTNFDEGFGGMATLLRVDPLGGCTAFPTSTKITFGTTRSGTYANLGAQDSSYYQVNSTTVTPFQTDWYGGFTGLPGGAQNLKVTYSGKNSNSAAPNADVSIPTRLQIWNWATSAWVQLAGPQPTGTIPVSFTDITPPGSASDYVGKGSFKGQVRVRVQTQRATGGGPAFFAGGNFMKIVYDAP
jgi:FtsP/CotA-like multicopper oxidase with cupredoxin domain